MKKQTQNGAGNGTSAQTKNGAKRTVRNFPLYTLKRSLELPQVIADEAAGQPMQRLLVAEALGIAPSSSNFRNLLSSAYKYGLTEGTEKAEFISLTQTGVAATQPADINTRREALSTAARTPDVFKRFYDDFAGKRVPSDGMFSRILERQYQVPEPYAEECGKVLVENAELIGLVRNIKGTLHILAQPADWNASNRDLEVPHADDEQDNKGVRLEDCDPEVKHNDQEVAQDRRAQPSTGPIFLGHGKRMEPLERLQDMLTSLEIPFRVTVEEANLGRPIPQKVRGTMGECGSAILIFTKDELLYDKDGKEVWRPSENVVHELGAASYAYGDRVVIFKEKGISFPTNFSGIGHIEFETNQLGDRTMELLKELVGFGLVKITPA